MSTGALAIFYVVFIIAAIIIGMKTKTNIGIIGFIFAVILGVVISGTMTVANVVSLWNTSTMVLLFITTMFYGYANANGTIQALANKLIYKTRRLGKLMPIMLYLVITVVSAVGGGGDVTPVIVGPLAYSIAAAAGFNPFLAFCAVFFGSMLGANPTLWAQAALLWRGLLETYVFNGDAARALSADWVIFLMLIIVDTAIFLIWYFVLKGYKAKAIDAEEPAPFTPQQKETMIVMVVVILALLIPQTLYIIFKTPATEFIKNLFDVKLLCALGVAWLTIRKLGKCDDILKNYVPWSLIVLICGLSTLIGMANQLGIAQYVGDALSTMPGFVIVFAVAALSGLLSMATNGVLVCSLIGPLIPALATASGHSMESLCVCMVVGLLMGGMSPASQGGAMALMGAGENEELRAMILRKQIPLAFAMIFGWALICALGFPSLFI